METAEPVRVRPWAARDRTAVVQLHARELADSFLGRLGTGFLDRLYEYMGADASFVCFVAERDGQVVGYVAATTDPAGFYRRIYLRHFAPLAVAVLLRALRAPSVALEAFGVLTGKSPSPTAPGPHAELLSIAVQSSRRHGGAGKELVTALFQAVAARGGRTCCVVVARGIPAHRFYRSMGFREQTTFLLHGAECSFYEVSFAASGAADPATGAASRAQATSASATATTSSSK